MNTRELTGGRDRDKGWTQRVPTALWTPSLHDRRRLAMSEAQLVAEVNQLPGIPVPLAIEVLVQHHSTDETDAEALVENFSRWLSKR